jgi:DNA-binding response OmpR family regulator
LRQFKLSLGGKECDAAGAWRRVRRPAAARAGGILDDMRRHVRRLPARRRRPAVERDGHGDRTGAPTSQGRDALARLDVYKPDIILLDLMLPDISGFDVCRELRRGGSGVPIVILSARSEEIDVVVGLEIGADDYILKPFRPRELIARLAAHLRKSHAEPADSDGRLVFRDLVIDPNERRVFRRGIEVNLTHTEFDLLSLLASNAGKVLSREHILNAVWGYEYPIETRVIDVHVRNLRRKIEDDPSHPLHILAVPGVGYRFTSSRA